MRCTVIFGSPRENSNTLSLTEPFLDELKKMGAEIDFFNVYRQRIEGCRACLGCQRDTETINCVVQDGMQPILTSIAASDLLVFAAPIYVWSAPAPVKAVIDRSVYASCKFYGDDPHRPALMKGKRLALIAACGYPVENGAGLYEEMMKRYCRHCGLTYVGMLAERQRNLKEPFMDGEKERRSRAFAHTVLSGEVSV